ncbi:hypothetical protein TSAR_015935 [Trichomalopsis sarcophagae]|uniref:Uncharacterized protein n=1 Tax=Trichomalopsis sarcophagae TaxID=543379 RepID=A0A232F0G7_9HYME|nr:hypothetical protein TSAR_015935 [Trichomalopsis sarcophagae]
MSRYVGPEKGYSMKLIDTLYSHVPAFTDIFDEETWYIFVTCFVTFTIVVFTNNVDAVGRVRKFIYSG